LKRFLILAALVAAPALADVSAVAGSLSGAAAQSGSSSLAGITTSGAQATQGVGNQQAITINGAPIPAQQRIETGGTTTVKTAPQVYAPPMGVTAPCRVALSAGVSVIGVGVAAGGSVPDAPCNLRELSRTYQALGAVEKAVKVADGALALECLDETTAKALGNLCPPKPTVQPLPTASAPAPVPMAAVQEVKQCRTEYQDGIMTKTCPL
jgi:hypothetical protein